ncbi:MAG: HlyD family secretion protein [Candidatus Sericytochromatia bacterium]
MSKSNAPQQTHAYAHILHQHMDTPRFIRRWGLIMLLMFMTGIVALICVPWQQNIGGSGEVIAFSPLDRSQNLEAPIDGRVRRWFVSEGSRVKKGDPIAELSDNDPDYIQRLQQQRQALQNQLEIERGKALAYELRLQDYQQALTGTREGALAKISAARSKLAAAEQDLESNQASLRTNRMNLERETILQEQGLSSQRTLELAEMSYQKSLADVEKDRAKIAEARSEVVAAQAEQQKAEASAQATLNGAQATFQEAQSSIQKLRAEMAKLDTTIARQANQMIRAPRAGTILKLSTFADSVYVKAGEILATLVPDTQEQAVALYVQGRDVPLLRPGREVRLQFEGWPALQFSGWPSVAIGTFGGEIVLIDSTLSEKGGFRIVVRPRPGENWPENQYLLQGMRANGWVLLDTVPLGYELWRQFNGFPPQVMDQPAEVKTTPQDVVKRKAK